MKFKVLWKDRENPSRKQKEKTGREEAKKEAGILGIGRHTKEKDCKETLHLGSQKPLIATPGQAGHGTGATMRLFLVGQKEAGEAAGILVY